LRGQLRTWPAWTRRNAPDSLLADQMRSAHLNYTNSKTDASRSQAVPFYFARACGDPATRPARQSENPGGSKARRQLPCSAIVVVRSRAQRNSGGSTENDDLSTHRLHASMHRTDCKIRLVAGSRNAQSATRSCASRPNSWRKDAMPLARRNGDRSHRESRAAACQCVAGCNDLLCGMRRLLQMTDRQVPQQVSVRRDIAQASWPVHTEFASSYSAALRSRPLVRDGRSVGFAASFPKRT
jgi:hypothetical protein